MLLCEIKCKIDVWATLHSWCLEMAPLMDSHHKLKHMYSVVLILNGSPNLSLLATHISEGELIAGSSEVTYDNSVTTHFSMTVHMVQELKHFTETIQSIPQITPSIQHSLMIERLKCTLM